MEKRYAELIKTMYSGESEKKVEAQVTYRDGEKDSGNQY